MSAKVTIVRNPFDVKKDKVFKVRNNTLVKDIKGFDINNSVVYVNGRHVDNNYRLQKNDYCVIRQYPSATITITSLITGLLVATAVVAVAEGISYLVSGRGLFANIGIALRKWLIGDTDSASNTPDQVQQLPSVSGSKNQSAYGRAIPLVLGRTYFSPYILGLPYNTLSGTDGEDDYYHALYLVGYNNIKVSDICMGTVDDISDNTEGVENGMIEDISPRFTSENDMQLEIRGTGEVSLYPCKVVQENFSEQLRNVNGASTPFYAFSARHPKKVELELSLQGLLAYDKQGNKKDAEARVAVDYSLDGGTTWTNCSNLIDLTHATGSSRYVPSQPSAQASFSYSFNGITSMKANVSMTLSSSFPKPLYVQWKIGSTWTNALTVQAGQTYASEDNVTMLRTECRFVVGSYISPSYKLSLNGTITANIPYEGYGGHILFKNQKNKTMRYVLRQTFTWEQMQNCDEKVVQYRVYRIDPDATETTIINKVYLTAIRTWCYDKTNSSAEAGLVDQIPMNAKERDKTTRIGMSLKATGDLHLDKINLVATSKARTFDGTGWSKTLSPTRNPASLALMLMTGDFRDSMYRYNLVESGDYVDCNKIDMQDFGRLYQECEEEKDFGNNITDKRFYCDGVVLNGTKSIDVINNVLNCARSNLVIRGKKYGVFTDKEQEYPLLVLNNNNLLSLSYSKAFEEIPDGQSIKYVSALNFYQQDTIVVKPYGAPALSAQDKIETVEYPFISDPYHAKAMSLYQQACKKLRPETINAKVTGEGGLAEIGSLVSLQTDKVLIGIGDGAEITELEVRNNYITAINTDGRFIVADINNVDYGVVINVVDALGNEKTLRKKLTFARTGTYSKLTFETPISVSDDTKPEEGCIVSFGIYENETLEMLCIGKEEEGDGTYGLTLVPYSPEIFEADEHIIHDFDPKTTPPSGSGMPINFGDITIPVSQQDLADATAEVRQEVNYGDDTPPDAPTAFTIIPYENYMEFSCIQNGTLLKDTVKYFEFEITRGEGAEPQIIKSASNKFVYLFDREVDGYPEAEDLSDWTFRARVINIYDVPSETWTTGSIPSSALGDYGTWKIPQIRVDTEVVDRTAILTAVYGGSQKVYGKIKTCVKVKRIGNTDEVRQGVTFNDMLGITQDSQFYTPKFDALVQTQSDADNEPNYRENTTTVFESVSNKISHTLPLIGQTYRIFKEGNILVTDSQDNPVFTKDVPDTSILPSQVTDNLVIHWTGVEGTFHNGGYYLFDDADLVVPTGEENPSELGWYELSDNKYVLSQDTEVESGKDYYILNWEQVYSKALIVPTTYQYEIYLVNESGMANKSNTCTVTVQALCTNIADVVHSHEHYKDLYVEKLSAINANIGLISQGGMGTFDQLVGNYWALSDLSAEDSGILGGVKKGAFRVGGADEYFKVTPKENGQYSIELKAGNIELTSDVSGDSALDFTNGTYVYSSNRHSRLKLSADGIVAQSYSGTDYDSWSDQSKITDISKVIADSKGNMIITNSNSTPEFGFEVDGDIYHFNDDAHPENAESGTNPQNLTVSGTLESTGDDTPILLYDSSKSYIKGTVEKNISSFNGTAVFFTKADSLRTQTKAIKINGTVVDAPEPLNGYSDAMKLDSTIDPNKTVGEYLGLNDTQVNTGIFY